MFLIFLLSSLLFLSQSIAIEIPNCPDIAKLSESTSELNDKLDQIKCVCSSEEARIEVNCVFGASLNDVANVLETIGKLNRTVQQINLNHVTVGNATSFLDLLIYESAHDVEAIEIKNCHNGPLEISGEINETTPEIRLQELQSLTIENCGLTDLPTALIQKTVKLQSISLNNNKIEFIAAGQLEKTANSLEYLDLTENLIGNIENGAFSQLKKLRTLLIGEHNFANTTVLNEISQIENLETLDLTRIDGINSLEQLDFSDNNRLERLVLTGCNIKMINSSGFSAFSQLKELDMRVNLIEKLEPESFAGLHNLERISLAGNFIKESELQADRWTDLKNLTQLDLGWNEIKKLRANSFGFDVGKSLRILSLRSNEKMAEIESNAFVGLSNLVNLNLSGSALEQLEEGSFNGLNSLELLDLSHNNLTSIDDKVFNAARNTLKSLNLANNKLRSFGVDSLLKSNLTELDISENNWLCDKNILTLTDWIRTQYKEAAKNSRSFLLANAAKTICERPYKLQGKNLMDLNPDDVSADYNEKLDTTTVPIIVENATELITQETMTAIDFSKLILDIGTKNDSLNVGNADEGKPQYDINSIRYGQKPLKESENAWVSGVVVSGLVILTIAGVLLAIKKNMKSSKNEPAEGEQAASSEV